MIHKIARCICFLLFFLSTGLQASTSLKLYYPRPETNFDERTGYPLQVLRFAFKNSDTLNQYQLMPGEMRIPRGRSLKLVEQGMGIDVFWAISTPERISKLAQVDFDIFKGLFGYRLLLIKNDRINEFKTLKDNEIHNKVAGMSPDWPDYMLLKKHGFNVQGTTSYNSLFKLLELDRVDYLPRSMFEVWFEHEHLQSKEISVSDDIALYYPAKFTFFFAKSNKPIAEELQKTLRAMESNGRFEQFFNLVWQDVITRSSLASKKIIRLSND